MEQAEITRRLSSGSEYGDLPGRHVTINQIVAYNLAYWRKVAGMTQEDLGHALGWSKAAVSAAERSWDGKRVRQFDADLIMAFATIFQVPISAFFLPPEDDGIKERYLYHVTHAGDYSDCRRMYDLMFNIMSEPSQDEPATLERYRQRYATTINYYLGDGRGPDYVQYLEDLTTEDEIVARLARSRDQYEALRGVISDIDRFQDALATRLYEIKERNRKSKKKNSRAKESGTLSQKVPSSDKVDTGLLPDAESSLQSSSPL